MRENEKMHLYLHIFPGSSDGKASAYNAGDPGSIPGSGRSPGEGNGNPLQCSCLENPMDRGAWWATVQGLTKSRTLHFHIIICVYILYVHYTYANVYIYVYINMYMYMFVYVYVRVCLSVCISALLSLFSH